MKFKDRDEARECLMDQVLSATTLEEIVVARQALRDWIARYPEEEGMRDGFAQLSLLQDVIEIQEAWGQRAIKQIA